ncbi:uncharacterized protein SCHCODRAFT_02609648 [Schizophyllum commune H4-8]|uniref:uncharacterized protein n=1 Tax=Schizophyllum commune (strain H4-8 / FGSC 9210) TaxID=578458 RepID=UPI002160FE3B|nr:uncharacterized protein SCHCODRAFT_02609648 [Schizophyllum commune H4-8]KAI5897553.1 hypothetical protein SCHCODRAFT_02609648 [Schizophyllum commune H4-8]
MEESRESALPPTRSSKYYMGEGDVIVKVENTLFRFHAYHLQRSTAYFDDLLAMTPPPPLEDDGADDCSISLDDVKASDFEALLWFYYESGCNWFGTATSSMNETWKSVLALAEQFSMEDVAKVACYALHRAGAELGDVRKISLCVRYDLPNDWMGPQIKCVLSRQDPLSPQECSQLGFEMTALLARYREEVERARRTRTCRSPDSCTKCITWSTTPASTVTCFHGVHICNEDATHHWECTAEVQLSPFLDSICDAIPKPNKTHSKQTLDIRPPVWGSTQGDLYLKAEDAIFCIHRYHLSRTSPVFANMLTLPQPGPNSTAFEEGRTAAYPIALEGETAETFADMLWFFYDAPYEWSERIDRKLVRRWESILNFATKYAMEDICKVASCALDHHGALSDVRKISLCIRHRIGGAWAQASFASICTRNESLTVQEVDELGATLTVQITKVREGRLRSIIAKARKPPLSVLRNSLSAKSSTSSLRQSVTHK